jgi:SAM-dependent methyltransferase
MSPTLRKLGRKLAGAAFHPGYHASGSCNICNRRTLFICDEVVDRWIRRCCWCRSTPKYRAIVKAIEAKTGARVQHYINKHKIYELSTTSPIFRLLHGHRNYEASGYFSDRPFGEKLSPFYWNQDLQNLTFPSESFDVVISSETMEHVRRPWQGFAEIRRVLKPGGFYFFTIPFRSDRLTQARVDTSGEQDVFTMEKMYHQDPYRAEDSLVYTDFGADLPELLAPIGFDAEPILIKDECSDIHDDLRPVRVFVAQKRLASPEIAVSQR